MTRDNTQLVVNELFKLPVEGADTGILAKLPERINKLPREKPVPADRPLTRWEKFAKAKGIKNRKRERFVWDEEKQKYVPRWGYAGGNKKEDMDDWLLEVPQNADPMEDQYAKKREEKKVRVEKNTKRRRRNEEEAAAATMSGKKDIKEFKKDELQAAIAAAKTATASLGKHDPELPKKKKKTGTTKKSKK